MSCPEITVEGIDKDFYARLLSSATLAGAHFSGNQASMSGLEFDWNYDGDAKSLHITCTKKPFIIGCGTVESKVRELIEQARRGI